VADGLAYTAIPLGLVPAGTGNLLAPNLDLPLEEADAIEVALDGQYALLRDLDANITPGWNRSLARPATMQSPDTPEPFGTRS
jgi:hypothetical protein